jgi:hypothetical protein
VEILTQKRSRVGMDGELSRIARSVDGGDLMAFALSKSKAIAGGALIQGRMKSPSECAILFVDANDD